MELNTTRDLPQKYISGMADESLISNFRKTEVDFDQKLENDLNFNNP
jgi:hypothetical protein